VRQVALLVGYRQPARFAKVEWTPSFGHRGAFAASRSPC
jgi:hypothetical protein